MPKASVMKDVSAASSTMRAYMSSTSEPLRGLKIGVMPFLTLDHDSGVARICSTAVLSFLLAALAVARSSPSLPPGSAFSSSQ